MINVFDAATLAVTKLRTRRVRTAVTVVTASLLFSVLVLAVTVVDGVISSARAFTSQGLSDRYIVSANFYGSDMPQDTPQLRASAERIYAKTVTDKRAEAKRLGIEYDSASEPRPIQGNGDDAGLDYSAPSVIQAIAEQQASQPTRLDTIRRLAAPYHPKAHYMSERSVADGVFIDMPDGKENSKQQSIAPLDGGFRMTRNITDGWTYLDQSVVEPFLLSEQSRSKYASSNDLPVVAPYSKVEQALKLQPLPREATPMQQLERLQYIRQHAADVVFTVCYRNQVSQMQISEAVRVADEIAKNKSNKAYQKPSLIYGLPASDSCGAATILSDTRPAAEKQYTDKQQQFDRTFGKVVDPQQQKITMRVVGLSPDMMAGQTFTTADALISMVAGSSLQGDWVVPKGLFEALPDKNAYRAFVRSDDSALQSRSFSDDMRNISPLIEFSSAADARAFMKNENCSNFSNCTAKPSLAYFGSNSVLIDDIAATSTKVLRIAGMIVGAIAALILMGMVGRVIADSRRETAVFRAIGAKRSDIRMVYVIYTSLLSLWIGLSATVLGLLAAWWMDWKWSETVTVRAQLAFAGVDGSLKFHLFGIWWIALGLIVALVVAAGLTSMLLPLSRNLARNPIKDMRDE